MNKNESIPRDALSHVEVEAAARRVGVVPKKSATPIAWASVITVLWLGVFGFAGYTFGGIGIFLADLQTFLFSLMGLVFLPVLVWFIALSTRSRAVAALSPGLEKALATDLVQAGPEADDGAKRVEGAGSVALRRLQKLNDALNIQAEALEATAHESGEAADRIAENIRGEREALKNTTTQLEERLSRLESMVETLNQRTEVAVTTLEAQAGKAAGTFESQIAALKKDADRAAEALNTILRALRDEKDSLGKLAKDNVKRIEATTAAMLGRLQEVSKGIGEVEARAETFTKKTKASTKALAGAGEGLAEKAGTISEAAAKALADLEKAEDAFRKKNAALEAEIVEMEGRMEAFGEKITAGREKMATAYDDATKTAGEKLETLNVRTMDVHGGATRLMDDLKGKSGEIEKTLLSLKEKFAEAGADIAKQIELLREEGSQFAAAARKSAEIVDLAAKRQAGERKKLSDEAKTSSKTLEETSKRVERRARELGRTTQDTLKQLETLAEKLGGTLSGAKPEPKLAPKAAKAKPAAPKGRPEPSKGKDGRTRTVISFRRDK